MRAYHFLPANYAVEDIAHRRLKIATFPDLNDPFELWAVAQPDARLRRALRRFKTTMSRSYGMLCFSRDWHNPVLWGHYADRHRGMVLGFDVADALIRDVTYVKTRPVFTNAEEQTVQELLFTKFEGWRYEEEARVFTRLQERDASTGLYYADFEEKLKLREVLTGPLCGVGKWTIEQALSAYAEPVTVIKTRLAFKSFRVVRMGQ